MNVRLCCGHCGKVFSIDDIEGALECCTLRRFNRDRLIQIEAELLQAHRLLDALGIPRVCPDDTQEYTLKGRLIELGRRKGKKH